MKNKAINHLKENTVDSLKNSKTKLPGYLAIGGIAAVSTLAGMTEVNAAQVGNGATHDELTATEFTFNTANKDLTVRSDNSGNPKISTIGVGAITDNATQGDLIITSQAADVTGLIVTVASVIMNAGTTVGANAITDVDNAEGDMTVTFSGAYLHDGALIISTTEDEDSETLTVNFDGATTFTVASIIDAGATGVTGIINTKFSAAAIFIAGLDLKDSADSAGTSTITFDGASAQAVGGIINGQADNMGTIAVSDAGKVTFAAAIGGINDIKNITVGTTADLNGVTYTAVDNSTIAGPRWRCSC